MRKPTIVVIIIAASAAAMVALIAGEERITTTRTLPPVTSVSLLPASSGNDTLYADMLVLGIEELAADFEKNIAEAKECGEGPKKTSAPPACRDPGNTLYQTQMVADLCASLRNSLQDLLEGRVFPEVSRHAIFGNLERSRVAEAFKEAQKPYWRECKPQAPSVSLHM